MLSFCKNELKKNLKINDRNDSRANISHFQFHKHKEKGEKYIASTWRIEYKGLDSPSLWHSQWSPQQQAAQLSELTPQWNDQYQLLTPKLIFLRMEEAEKAPIRSPTITLSLQKSILNDYMQKEDERLEECCFAAYRAIIRLIHRYKKERNRVPQDVLLCRGQRP